MAECYANKQAYSQANITSNNIYKITGNNNKLSGYTYIQVIDSSRDASVASKLNIRFRYRKY